MIQMQTSLEVADNSGARRVEMIAAGPDVPGHFRTFSACSAWR